MFDTLNLAAKRFCLEASKWHMPKDFFVKAQQASEITSYLEWEKWMFQDQTKVDDFWAVHESWLRVGSMARKIKPTSKTKMVGFMLTFVGYDRIKTNQPKVRNR